MSTPDPYPEPLILFFPRPRPAVAGQTGRVIPVPRAVFETHARPAPDLPLIGAEPRPHTGGDAA